LRFYSPYNFLRNIISTERQQELFGSSKLVRFTTDSLDNKVFTHKSCQLLYTVLQWDSDFFGTPTYRLQTGLFNHSSSLADQIKAVKLFEKELAHKGAYYCFSEVPCEDTLLLQTLTASGWRLIETRLLYYHDNVIAFNQGRYPVRLARIDEEAHIAQISSNARNEYDRFHADPWFGSARADAFLGRYASAAVQGYCDAVLVPDEPGLPVDSFLAISDLQADAAALGLGMSRVVLTAVGPKNRGWHLRLVSETLHRAREKGDQVVLMTTQATNRAVFRTSEKLGFKLGGSSHVLACHGGQLPSQ
jgi:dTDP-4-amino-4,6-dideoxy-D-galactose acyltransferase